MTSEGLGEMFEGDSADTCARKFPLVLMGGRKTFQLLVFTGVHINPVKPVAENGWQFMRR